MEHFDALPKEMVTPLCVFAAGRKEFEVVVRKPDVSNAQALALIFEHVPLAENGWDIDTTSISYAGMSSDKWHKFQVRRVAVPANHSSPSHAPAQSPRGGDDSLGGKRKQPSPAAVEGTHSAGSM